MNSKKRLFSTSLLVLSISIFVLTGGIFFSFSLRNTLLEQQKNYLQEVVKRASYTLTAFLEREMTALKSMSTIFANFYSYSSLDEYLTILKEITTSYLFKDTGLLLLNNKVAYFANGETVENFLPEQIIQEVINGKSVISNLRYDPFTKQPIIIYTTPFKVNGKTEAILFATQGIEELQNRLAQYKVSGGGFIAVLNNENQLIVDTSQDLFKPQDLKELLSFYGGEGLKLYTNLITNFDKNNRGIFSYVTKDSKEQKLISFEKISVLGLKNWHLIFVIPTKVISVVEKKIFLGSLVSCFTLLLSFALILVFIDKREEEQKQEIFDTAFKDKVTGSFNMARFQMEMKEILHKQKGNKFALVLLDIDNFKLINDLYGFRQGDLVLNHIANVLEENTDIKKGEIFARLIGDVFLLLVNYNLDKDITDRLDKIYDAIQNCYAITDLYYNINTSFGIYKISEELPFYLMLDRVNLAKKASKESIHKRYMFYNEESFKNVLQNKEIENSMYQALKDEEFKLYFQPKCLFDKKDIVGAEVLVRWEHHKKGLILPDKFIPIFEDNGFIIKLDFYVLEHTLQILKTWLERGLKPCKLSINFSRLHLKDELTLPKIKALLDFYKIPANLIELEITENAVMKNTPEAKKFVEGLHELGITVAMDDFGSGYSSLNVLKDLPFDTLKIDKEFLKDFGTNPRTSSILKGIITMLKNMNTAIVAEGVETSEQAQFLQTLNCDFAQGFLYYKPINENNFQELLPKNN